MRKFTGFVLATVLMVFASFAAAQDDAPAVFCGELSEADCAPLVMASETLPDSADFEINGTAEIDTGEQVTAFSVEGTGRYLITDANAAETLIAANANFASDPNALNDALLNALTALNSEMTLSVAIPDEVTGGAIPSNLTLHLFLKDGSGYVDFDELALSEDLTGVYGIDLAPLAEQALQQNAPFSLFGNEETLAALGDPRVAGTYTTITRGDDVERDGETAATYTTTVDYAEFFATPQASELLAAQLAQQPNMSEEDAAEAASLFADAFVGSTAEVTQVIGTETGYIYETTNDIALDFDPSLISEAMGDTTGSTTPLDMDINVSVTQSNFDGADAVELPDGAEVVPLETVQSFLMGGGALPEPEVEVEPQTE